MNGGAYGAIIHKLALKELKMTLRQLNLPADFSRLNKVSVGFDRMFNDLLHQVDTMTETGYPPYNIIRETDSTYYIQIAVAGFGEDEISVTVKDNQLHVIGETAAEDTATYIHKGISKRKFTRVFNLADHVQVKSAVCHNGLLSITLERIIPEEMQPKAIPITFQK